MRMHSSEMKGGEVSDSRRNKARMRRAGAGIGAVLVLIAVMGLTQAGCKTAIRKGTAYPLTLVDDLGRKVTVAAAPRRLVSLAPDNTEILYALGLGRRIVGVTTFCNYPAEAKMKPKIGDMMNPNVEKIIALKPDLVLATGGVQNSVVDQLKKVGVAVVVTSPKDYEGVIRNIGLIGKITGSTARAGVLTRGMRRRRDEIRAKVAGKPRPKAFYEVYKEPLMTAGPGTFIDDLIKLAGGVNIAGNAQKDYPEYSLEMLLAQDPDVYLASSGTMGSAGEVGRRPGWGRLQAVKNQRVFVIDQDIISRGGPRLARALGEVAGALHPEVFGPAVVR